jgi:hypothetical protein
LSLCSIHHRAFDEDPAFLLVAAATLFAFLSIGVVLPVPRGSPPRALVADLVSVFDD